ncbi:TauD/TfdA family dioxygenase [Allokutzneria sp. A3M-2-11 16]|uniref:guanitoxin biosynthesis L-enduracididine beta-hydroxylase GntD n=1 Tax=Allokutzneria sp. A3M-2-11 16 TaxID=2962043 RepID=UPI0020B6C01C|nr:guanitoxin biosynthesis L-enduracididine beta-hydroxylase GntD [Allokutzneria sp. A3M-2-11 16]MCP3804328.1 TauD/TfdA family dioxygenase [Allokutzneria sp. A3M-2-11 16]
MGPEKYPLEEPSLHDKEFGVLELSLRDAEVAAIERIAAEVAHRYGDIESAEFHRDSRAIAEELPRRVREALHRFRASESDSTFVTSGLPVDDERVGPTPPEWRDNREPSRTLVYDVAFFLMAALLGDPIAWATQQDGRIMHDVFPLKAHENEQIGWGSAQLLTWHTEDAFHPLRTDYLGLMCLRNNEQVETTVADVSDLDIDPHNREILSQKRFRFVPDNAHRPQNNGLVQTGQAAELLRRSQERVEKAMSDPEPEAVLFGGPELPYLRIDPEYMLVPEDPEERKALDVISSAIDVAMGGVVLQPGDIIFVDNYRAVHGRKPFKARFDGTDRWLRRLNVARDLRKSRDCRLDAESRVIY